MSLEFVLVFDDIADSVEISQRSIGRTGRSRSGDDLIVCLEQFADSTQSKRLDLI